jgi:hypothetical protein
LAKGFRNYKKKPNYKRHNDKNDGGEKKRLLDMGRRKYFGYDLEDLMEEKAAGDNASIIIANIINKYTTNSYDDTLEYVKRIRDEGSIDEALMDEITRLMRKYSKWR